MKKIFPALAIALVILSCNNAADKNKFTVTGEMKNSPDQKVYLEELFFSQQPPEVLDTAIMKNGKFSLAAIAAEEGLYRIRRENETNSFLFINDKNDIKFTGDADNPGPAFQNFNTDANLSLKEIMLYSDSLEKLMASKDRLITELKKSGAADNDSIYMSLTKELNSMNEALTNYCFKVADTAKSPVVSLFAATMAPVPLSRFEGPLSALAKRFPDHKGIAGALSYIKAQIAQLNQPQPPSSQQMPSVGSMAPEITMNDVNGKPFSLSQLRGKYVLVDFWASWCGPCRGENPNVVAAYNKFKDKNFTVLGVSLDDDKDSWTKAIADDGLSWPQISDLKKWSSASVALYGFDGIPYNVLVDPQGKIIATRLRGDELQTRLAAILK